MFCPAAPYIFQRHRYTKWSKPVVTKDGALAQQKYCTYCNKVKVRFT